MKHRKENLEEIKLAKKGTPWIQKGRVATSLKNTGSRWAIFLPLLFFVRGSNVLLPLKHPLLSLNILHRTLFGCFASMQVLSRAKPLVWSLSSALLTGTAVSTLSCTKQEEDTTPFGSAEDSILPAPGTTDRERTEAAFFSHPDFETTAPRQGEGSDSQEKGEGSWWDAFDLTPPKRKQEGPRVEDQLAVEMSDCMLSNYTVSE